MKNYEGWATGLHLQNLGSETAHVTIEYFRTWGVGAYIDYATLEPDEAYFSYHPALDLLPNGCYCAIVSSDQPVSALVNQTNYSLGIADSYDAPPVAEEVFLPLVYRGHAGWYSTIAVQNADMSIADAVVEFYSEGHASPVFTTTLRIDTGGVTWVDLAQATYDPIGAPWFGSAVVRADRKLAVVANHIKVPPERTEAAAATSQHVMTTTPGWTEGARELIAPLVFKNYSPNDESGWTTGIDVQNLGDEVAYVTVTINRTNGEGSWNITKAVQPNSFACFYMPDYTYIPDGTFGSALITADRPIAAVVSHTKYAADVATAYNALPRQAATTRISLPMWHKRYSPNDPGGWTTGIHVMNLGDEPINIRVRFYHQNKVDSWEKWAFDVKPGYAALFYLPEFAYIPDGSWGWAVVGNPYQEEPIAAIANSVKYQASVLSSYRGINY